MNRQRLTPETIGESWHIRKSLCVVAIFLGLLSSTVAKADLLISESFEGPNSLQWWDGGAWQTITNFVGSGFNQGYSDAKYDLGKATTSYLGSQSMRLYGEYQGGTSEFWTNPFSPARSELWITWWEKLSSSYDVNEGHKWFLMQMEGSGDPYISWQSWDSSPGTLASRVYNSGAIACADQTFAPTTTIGLPSNQWYQYKVHVKLNTIGINNGFFQVWIKKDGVNWTKLWDLQNVGNIRCNAARDIVALRFGGTRQKASGVSSSGTKWIDDIKIGTAEADVSGGSGAIPIAAPANVHFTN